MIRTLVIGTAMLAAGTAAAQQQQKIVPPGTVYWMSAATQSGFGLSPGSMPDAGAIMRMGLGGRGGPVRTLDLDLGSRHAPAPPPPTSLVASHALPPAAGMGALPLKSPPAPVRGRAEPSEPPEPPEFERPKGRLLLFWGCGEVARPGQPVVIDFARVAEGQVPPGLFAGERVRIARPPSSRDWPTHGRWPNDDRAAGSKAIPARASLIGDHRVAGGFTPDIAFALQQDWMEGLALSQAKAPSGALNLSWNAVPGATGHFAQLIGGQGDGGEATVVFWSSSEVQTFVSALSDYLAPAEAARLVRGRQLMPPTQTSCAIPKEVMATVAGGLVSLVAHGPEVNMVHPPRPADPKIPWVQEWAVKARFVSRAGALAGMDMPAMGAAAGPQPAASGKPKCRPDAGEAAGASAGRAAGGLLGGGLGRAIGGGIGAALGKKKPAPEDCEL